MPLKASIHVCDSRRLWCSGSSNKEYGNGRHLVTTRQKRTTWPDTSGSFIVGTNATICRTPGDSCLLPPARHPYSFTQKSAALLLGGKPPRICASQPLCSNRWATFSGTRTLSYEQLGQQEEMQSRIWEDPVRTCFRHGGMILTFSSLVLASFGCKWTDLAAFNSGRNRSWVLARLPKL